MEAHAPPSLPARANSRQTGPRMTARSEFSDTSR